MAKLKGLCPIVQPEHAPVVLWCPWPLFCVLLEWFKNGGPFERSRKGLNLKTGLAPAFKSEISAGPIRLLDLSTND